MKLPEKLCQYIFIKKSHNSKLIKFFRNLTGFLYPYDHYAPPYPHREYLIERGGVQRIYFREMRVYREHLIERGGV